MSRHFVCDKCATPIVINGHHKGDCPHYPKVVPIRPDDISNIYKKMKGMTMRRVG